MKSVKPAKKAFRFPKTFTAKVTQFIWDKSAKRKQEFKNWRLLTDCPVAVAARRALKLTRSGAEVTRVDASIWSGTGKFRRYTHDGSEVIKAFDEGKLPGVRQVKPTFPVTVTFTLEKIEG